MKIVTPVLKASLTLAVFIIAFGAYDIPCGVQWILMAMFIALIAHEIRQEV